MQRLCDGRAVLAAEMANQLAVAHRWRHRCRAPRCRAPEGGRRGASGGASRTSGTSAAARRHACARSRSGRRSSGSRPRPPWRPVSATPLRLTGRPNSIGMHESAIRADCPEVEIGGDEVGHLAVDRRRGDRRQRSASSRPRRGTELPIQREPAVVPHEIAEPVVGAGPGRSRSADASRNTSGRVRAGSRRSPGSSSSCRTALSK